MLEPTIAYPEQTTYVIYQSGDDTPQAIDITPDLCLYLGAGSTIIWQGTDEAAWRAEQGRLGIVLNENTAIQERLP